MSAQWLVQGFGPGTTLSTAYDLLFGVGWPVIPLGSFQKNGLTSVVVASDSDPPQQRYATHLGVLMISSHDLRFAHGGKKKIIVSEGKSSNKENATPSVSRELLRSLPPQSSLPDPWQASRNQALTMQAEDLETNSAAWKRNIVRPESRFRGFTLLSKMALDPSWQQLRVWSYKVVLCLQHLLLCRVRRPRSRSTLDK